MTRAERKQWRATLKAQRKVMRQRMKERVAALRKSPTVAAALAQQKRRKRRRQLTILAIILLLLLLIQLDCECDPVPPAEGTLAPVATADAGPPVPDQKPFRGKIKKSKRPPMDLKPPPPPSWLAQFRLQVAARSPRLGACFNDQEKPGAMRWSALVHARSGRVSESVVEPVFRGVSLTNSQRNCLIKGLTEQRYNLDEPDPEAPARRVSLIFEF